MEIALTEARARLSQLVAAARNGERVVITKRGQPAVELVPCPEPRRGGIDFEKLEATLDRLGVEKIPPEEFEARLAEFNDLAFSREVLGLGDDYEPFVRDPEER